MAQFMILSLPRSRSKWLSSFLSIGDTVCGHDLLVGSRSIADFEQKLSMVTGSCETGAVIGWRLLRERMPQLRLATVHRPVDEVIDSIARQGYSVPRELLEERAAMLEELTWQDGVEPFDYDALDHEIAISALWQWCLPDVPWSHERWLRWRECNIQIDFGARMSELAAATPQLEALRAEVARETRGLRCLN